MSLSEEQKAELRRQSEILNRVLLQPALKKKSAKRPAWADWRCPDCSRTTVAVYHPHGEECPDA